MQDNSQAVAAGAAAAPEAPAYDAAAVVRHLAHELRQPLSTIESIAFYLEMVLPRTAGKARKQLGKMQQEVHQINWILTDAIHFLRAAPLKLELLDLTEAVDKGLAEWKTEGGTGVSMRLGKDLPLARLDLEQVEHLLRNVIAFFGRVSVAGQPIVVRTYAAGAEVLLEISAVAPDLREDELRHLFEPFDARLPSGSGLALASVRRIADAHRARVWLDRAPAGSVSLLIAFPAA